MQVQIEFTAVETEPTVLELAKRFFSITQDDNHKVILTTDAIAQVKKAVSKGGPSDSPQQLDEHFDILYVDVCQSGESNIICPSPAFLEDSLWEDVDKLVANGGAVAVKVFVTRERKAAAEKVKKYLE